MPGTELSALTHRLGHDLPVLQMLRRPDGRERQGSLSQPEPVRRLLQHSRWSGRSPARRGPPAPRQSQFSNTPLLHRSVPMEIPRNLLPRFPLYRVEAGGLPLRKPE